METSEDKFQELDKLIDQSIDKDSNALKHLDSVSKN